MGKVFQDGIRVKSGCFVLLKNSANGKTCTDLSEISAAESAGTLVTEMITTSDTKEFFTTGINAFFMEEDPDADMQWEQLYSEVPSGGAGELLPFRDPDEAGKGVHGVKFEEVGEGGEIKFSTTVSNEKYVKAVKYATAIGYSNEWFDDGSLGLVEMVTEDFRKAANDKLAAIHYGILETAITSGISKSSNVAGTTLDDFIDAINAAVAVMWRNKYRPDFILGAPEQEDIIQQALSDVYRNDRATANAQRLRPLISEHLKAGQVLLLRSRKRLVTIPRLGLTLGNFQDLLHDAETLVGKFRRGAAMLDGRCLRAIKGL